MTVEQCWKERDFVEMSCIVDGLGADATDDNYWLYADSDCYEVINGLDYENNRLNPRTYDIFYPTSRSLLPYANALTTIFTLLWKA